MPKRTLTEGVVFVRWPSACDITEFWDRKLALMPVLVIVSSALVCVGPLKLLFT
jgi:hypothetical protein